MKQRAILDKLLSLLKVRETIAGLEISDSVLRFANFDGKSWQTAGLRLPPGIVQNGEVKDVAQFVEALRALRQQVLKPRERNRKINVAVSLSSVNIYSQVFSLPMIEGENLEKAIELNIQMVSPAESSQTYAGWQLVGQDQKSLRLEILSAFISRSIVDGVKSALYEAGFLVHSVESRALSLVRLLREMAAGFDPEKSYLLLNLDSSGLEFLVIRRNHLYFQYFSSWTDIQGGERQIAKAAFDSLIVRNLHQVLNFYNSHWPEPLAGIFVSATNMREEVAEVVGNNFPLKILDLHLKLDQAVSPDWLVALGAGLRSLLPHREDRDISLLGLSAQEEFRRHELIAFVRFWQLLIPVSLALLLAVFVMADVFLVRTRRSLEARVALAGRPEQQREISELRNRAKEFNRLVSLVGGVEGAVTDKFPLIDKVNNILTASGLRLRQFYFQGQGAPVLVGGWADSEEQILKFKKTLDESPEFRSVNLPFDEIRSGSQGLSFSVSFLIAPSSAE